MNFVKTTYTNLLNWLQHTYAFTRAEQRAVVVLLGIAISALLLNIVLRLTNSTSTMPMLNISYEAVDTSYYKKNYTNNYSKHTNYDNDAEVTPTTALQPMDTFNPNTANDNFWQQQVGLSNRQLGTLRKFQLRGAVFYSEQDVQKCYAITPALFSRIQPFIRLPKSDKKQYVSNYTPSTYETKAPLRKVEINQADTTQLIALPGIGRTLANRIVKYRDRLGGFVNTQQLLEVYGLDSSKYNLMIPRITLDAYFVSGILINDISAAELRQHPYFDGNTARIVIMYRNAHGRFKNNTELKNTDVITDELFSKIVPYIRM